MSKISRLDILKLARISRLKLSDEEIERLESELTEILTYVETLNSADTAGVEPTYQISGLTNVTRPDEVKDYGYLPSDLLNNAPSTLDNHFKVKRVIN